MEDDCTSTLSKPSLSFPAGKITNTFPLENELKGVYLSVFKSRIYITVCD